VAATISRRRRLHALREESVAHGAHRASDLAAEHAAVFLDHLSRGEFGEDQHVVATEKEVGGVVVSALHPVVEPPALARQLASELTRGFVPLSGGPLVAVWSWAVLETPPVDARLHEFVLR